MVFYCFSHGQANLTNRVPDEPNQPACHQSPPSRILIVRCAPLGPTDRTQKNRKWPNPPSPRRHRRRRLCRNPCRQRTGPPSGRRYRRRPPQPPHLSAPPLPGRPGRPLSGRQLPYDYLVLATGATHSYFGRDDWAPFAPGLKTIEDALEIRRRVLLAFELAERQMVEHGWHPPLNFVV